MHNPARKHMKITALEIEPDSVRIRTDSDAVGRCEVSRPEHVRIIDADFRSALIDADPFRREALWQEFMRRAGADPAAHEALASVDAALWDLLGVSLRLPVHRVIGGFRERVPYMALGTPTTSIDIAVEQVREAARVGCTAFCSRFVGSIEESLILPKLLRTAAGEDFVLAHDGGRRHRAADALRIGRALDAHDYFWFVHPLAAPEPEALHALAARLDTPILDGAAGPDAFAHAAHLVGSQSVDALHIDVRRCGGITGALKLARMAEAFGIHCAFDPDDGCGGRAIAHLLGAMRNAPFALIDMPTPNIAAAEGLHVPSVAGL